MAISLLGLFIRCSPTQSQPQYFSEPVPYYKTREAYTPPNDAERLAGECNAKKVRSCLVLAHAYEHGDLYGVGKDPGMAATYWLKGCDLGDGDGCQRMGHAYAKGDGVQVDKQRAARFYRRSCEGEVSTMTRFACADLALLLLEFDRLGNFEEAMRLFARTCALGGDDSPSCKLREFYEGTGRVSTAPPPTGAVGYAFGISQKEAVTTCARLGGKSEISRGLLYCRGQRIEVLSEDSFYVSLDFCKRDALCEIGVALNRRLDNVFSDYVSIRDRLSNLYGVPSKISERTTPSCRTDAVMARCLEAKDAEFSALWGWNGKAVVTEQIAAAAGAFAIVLGYSDAASINASKASGL